MTWQATGLIGYGLRACIDLWEGYTKDKHVYGLYVALLQSPIDDPGFADVVTCSHSLITLLQHFDYSLTLHVIKSWAWGLHTMLIY